MFCPRCNTELSDSATICSQCGSPVSVSLPPQLQASTFSYLPSGTPQWPTTAPANVPYMSATGYAPTEYEPDDSLEDLEPVRRARKPGSLSLPAILLLLFVSILIGGGLTYASLALQHHTTSSQQPTRPISLTPATATTPGTQASTPTVTGDQLPTPTSFLLASSTDLGFSMQYPAGWIQDKPQQGTNGNKDIAFHPSTQLSITLFIAQISAANSAQVSSTGDVNAGNIDGFGTNSSLPTPQVLTNTPTNRTIGGVSWAEEDAVFTPTSGSPIHVVSLAVKHTVYYYNILFFAPTSTYDEAMAKYYTKMLSSFQFTA